MIPNQRNEQWFRLRLGIIFVLFLTALSAVVFRLTQLQVLPNNDLQQLAKRQFQKRTKKEFVRIPIYDRNGAELAVNIRSGSVFCHPKLVKNPKKTSRRLQKLLGNTTRHWYKKITSKKKFIWLKRKLSLKRAKKVQRAKIAGIFVAEDVKRYYPNGPLASNIIGFTNIDGRGLAGIELQFEKKMKIPKEDRGYRDYETSYINGTRNTKLNATGLYLTIDRSFQYAVEKQIQAAKDSTGAKSVLAIAMNPLNGEILAMAQTPNFNPNWANRYAPQSFVNRSISHLYEPGSTLKVLLAAQVIEKKIMTENTPIDCQKGKIRIGRKIIREAEFHQRYGILPLKDVIRFSSNVGAVQIGKKLGRRSIRNAFYRFGLLSKTDIELPAEALHTSKPMSKWSQLRIATSSFGQGISATPIQIVRSFSAFANGGFLIQPTIRMGSSPKKPKKILSPKTVSSINRMLVEVTRSNNGTGRRARIAGLTVAGKTGTAQKYIPGAGYRSGKYFSSFVGYFPAESPKLVIGVFVDEPEKDYYGSIVAAPLFARIGEQAVKFLNILPGRAVTRNTAGWKTEIQPKVVTLPKFQKKGRAWIMPDLHGHSLRDVMFRVGKRFPKTKWSGSGYLVEQKPSPGTRVTRRTKLTLKFSPQG